MAKRVYNYYTDPDHGWVKVKLSELESLKINHKISAYSYVNNYYVYLEEDYDLSIFIRAKAEKGIKVTLKIYNSNKPSRIRSYSRYYSIMALKNSPEVAVNVNDYNNGECKCRTLTSGSDIEINKEIIVNEEDLITLSEAYKKINETINGRSES